MEKIKAWEKHHSPALKLHSVHAAINGNGESWQRLHHKGG